MYTYKFASCLAFTLITTSNAVKLSSTITHACCGKLDDCVDYFQDAALCASCHSCVNGFPPTDPSWFLGNPFEEVNFCGATDIYTDPAHPYHLININ